MAAIATGCIGGRVLEYDGRGAMDAHAEGVEALFRYFGCQNTLSEVVHHVIAFRYLHRPPRENRFHVAIRTLWLPLPSLFEVLGL